MELEVVGILWQRGSFFSLSAIALLDEATNCVARHLSPEGLHYALKVPGQEADRMGADRLALWTLAIATRDMLP
jgi:hypothetical protein